MNAVDVTYCRVVGWVNQHQLDRLDEIPNAGMVRNGLVVCHLEAGHTGTHLGLLEEGTEDESWLQWTTAPGEGEVVFLAPCPVESVSPGGRPIDSGCTLPKGHPGRHSFDIDGMLWGTDQSPVSMSPAAPAEAAVEHFAAAVAFETDCWSVHAAITDGPPDFMLVDARPRAIFDAGHVPGAVSLPPDAVDACWEAYGGHRLTVVYGADLHSRDADETALRFARRGDQVKIMAGGFEVWTRLGFPIVAEISTSVSAPPIPMEGVDAAGLLAAARDAAGRAYTPYSRFRVGAAVACADGTVITGCNIENASYGLSQCAERTAVFTAVAAGHRDLVAIAVALPDAPAGAARAERMPCGACRQCLHELLGANGLVIVDGAGTFTVADLLPDAFIFTPPAAPGPATG